MKITLVSATVALCVCFAGAFVYFREPIQVGWFSRNLIAATRRSLLSQKESMAIAKHLREFAIEHRWNNPTHPGGAQHYSYDDPTIPDELRLPELSSIQIDDDKAEIVFAVTTREQASVFSIAAWRQGLLGTGTKNLAPGVWYNSFDKPER